jgi:hypothetical protein
MQKELPNGRANWQLASGEQRWVSPRCWGRNGDGEGSFGRLFPSHRRRRERVVPVLHVGDSRPTVHCSGETMAWHWVPCSVPLMGGPQSVF